jgi:hypothetical protein
VFQAQSVPDFVHGHIHKVECGASQIVSDFPSLRNIKLNIPRDPRRIDIVGKVVLREHSA